MSEIVEFARRGNIPGIERLLDSGTDIDAQDERGQTAAMAATYENHIVVARYLMEERGANPDMQDDMLNNPFLYAGAEGYLEILKIANEAGADPAILNRYGGTALIPAAEHGYVEVVRFLLEETEVDVNHVNNLGWTALLEAIILGDGGPAQQETIRILLEHDADPNIADGDGVTPLAHAKQRGFTELIRLLEATGAS